MIGELRSIFAKDLTEQSLVFSQVWETLGRESDLEYLEKVLIPYCQEHFDNNDFPSLSWDSNTSGFAKDNTLPLWRDPRSLLCKRLNLQLPVERDYELIKEVGNSRYFDNLVHLAFLPCQLTSEDVIRLLDTPLPARLHSFSVCHNLLDDTILDYLAEEVLLPNLRDLILLNNPFTSGAMSQFWGTPFSERLKTCFIGGLHSPFVREAEDIRDLTNWFRT